jgi:hypothetical protein
MSEDELRLSGQGFNIESDLIFDERKESYEDYRKRVRERREEHNRDNEIELQIANFYVQRQALQKTLNISYGSLVISSFAVVVALLAVVVSLASH